MSFDVLGVMTNTAKARLAQMLATGKSYKITDFVIGDMGTLPSDPTIALTPDPSITSYVYGNVLQKPVDSVSFATEFCPVCKCTVNSTDYVGPISAIYLLGTIVYSPIPGDPEIGLKFIAAVATRPREIIAPGDSFVFNNGIALG